MRGQTTPAGILGDSIVSEVLVLSPEHVLSFCTDIVGSGLHVCGSKHDSYGGDCRHMINCEVGIVFSSFRELNARHCEQLFGESIPVLTMADGNSNILFNAKSLRKSRGGYIAENRSKKTSGSVIGVLFCASSKQEVQGRLVLD